MQHNVNDLENGLSMREKLYTPKNYGDPYTTEYAYDNDGDND